MKLPLVSISKFVGTVSLGLLTGVSYTLTTLTLPSLLFLPTAPSAAQTHAFLKQRSRRVQKVLTAVAISTFTIAYTISPSRGKHPYLLYSSLICAMGLAPGLRKIVVARSDNSEEGFASGSRIEMEESGVIVTPPVGSTSSESGDEDTVNGEVVRKGVERGQAVESVRTAVYGLAFSIGVIGLWGDGI